MQFPATLVFCGRKAPSPSGLMRENFFTLDLSISCNFQQLWFFCWQKSPPPPKMRENFLHWIYPFHAISSNFGFFSWQKSPPPQSPLPQQPKREIFSTLNLSISCNFQQLWFLWQKSPPPHDEMREKFLHWIYPFHAISSNFGFCGRKAPPPSQMRENSFTLNLSISCNFQQLWFFVAEGPPPPPPRMRGKFFYTESIHFMQFPATLVFLWQKSPPPQDEGNIFTLNISISCNFQQLWFFCGRKAPPPKDEGIFFYTESIHFMQFPATLVFCGRNAPPSPQPGNWQVKNFFTLNLSISCNFKQLWFFVAEKPPPPPPQQPMRENFLHWIYPFHAISSNQQKSPPLWKFFFLSLSISWFLWQKSPSPPPWPMREFFFTLNLSISCNFQQLWFFCGRKAPPQQPEWGKILLHWIYPFHAISSNFGFCGRKASPPPPRMRENSFTLNLSIPCHFQQLWFFLWQKSLPPPLLNEGKFFYTESIHFMQFPATLVFVAEKPSPSPPPPEWGKILLHWIYYPFHAISSNFGFLWQKSPPPQNEGKFFYTESIHFMPFPATLVFVAEKPPSPRTEEGKNLRLDLSISCNFQQLWFSWQKRPHPSVTEEGKI